MKMRRRELGLFGLSRKRRGQLRVQRLEGQESFRIAPLLQANAWAVFPAEAQSLAAGALVRVFPMEPGSTITSFQE